ncbi:hypothetical protein FI667_g14589, partial [Globisporangium splendens]
MDFSHATAPVVPLSPTAEDLREEISNSPAQDHAQPNERDVSARLRLQYQLHRLATQRAVNAPAVFHGQYSINKLEAFAKYESSTSIPYAILVLLVSPVPCLAIMLLLQCFPLADPMLGWKANYVYFMRTFAGTFATCISVATVINEFIPETQLSWRHLALIGFTQAIVFVGINIVVAEAFDVFPVPFSMLIPIGPMLNSVDSRVPAVCDDLHAALIERSSLVLTASPCAEAHASLGTLQENADSNGRGQYDAGIRPLIPRALHRHVPSEFENAGDNWAHFDVEHRSTRKQEMPKFDPTSVFAARRRESRVEDLSARPKRAPIVVPSLPQCQVDRETPGAAPAEAAHSFQDSTTLKP